MTADAHGAAVGLLQSDVTMPRRAIALAALLVLTAAAKKDKPTRFLPEDAVDVAAVLPDPPAADSAEARAERDAVLAAVAARTPADVARIRAEEQFDVFAFADVLGPAFTAERCPRTAALFASVTADAKTLAKVGKEHFDRRRPPFVDERIKAVAVAQLEDEGGYPSSHAVRGQLFAEVLAAAVPDRRDALLARGRQIGFDRLLGGVHYPSDITAGRVLGHAIAGRLLADARVRAQLDEVRTELSAIAR